MILGSIGCAILSISTGNCVASLQLENKTEACRAKDTGTTKHVHPAGQPGRLTTLFHFVAIVNFVAVILFYLVSLSEFRSFHV